MYSLLPHVILQTRSTFLFVDMKKLSQEAYSNDLNPKQNKWKCHKEVLFKSRLNRDGDVLSAHEGSVNFVLEIFNLSQVKQYRIKWYPVDRFCTRILARSSTGLCFGERCEEGETYPAWIYPGSAPWRRKRDCSINNWNMWGRSLSFIRCSAPNCYLMEYWTVYWMKSVLLLDYLQAILHDLVFFYWQWAWLSVHH